MADLISSPLDFDLGSVHGCLRRIEGEGKRWKMAAYGGATTR